MEKATVSHGFSKTEQEDVDETMGAEPSAGEPSMTEQTGGEVKSSLQPEQAKKKKNPKKTTKKEPPLTYQAVSYTHLTLPTICSV
eukprot:12492225-Alexandrium_andersonii.AAC.1